MPYTIDWWLSKRVILVTLSGILNSREVITSSVQLTEHIHSGEPPVHLVLDSRQMHYISPRLDRIYELTAFLQHPNAGETIIIQNNRLLRFIAYVVSAVQCKTFHYVDELSHAQKILRTVDDTLPHLPEPPV